jgi:NTE family protein
VGISINLPVLFKPVRVDADVPTGEHHAAASAYRGEWVDGGLLNNLPLHAFDHIGQPPETPSFSLPLNPHVLGIRLTENPDRSYRLDSEGFATLKRHLGDVVETLMFPAEQGQIRTAQEAAQTIDLLTYGLSTTEFAPPPSASAKPIQEAERAVYKHFGGSMFRTATTALP